MQTELQIRISATQMCEAYAKAKQEIADAYAQLETALERLSVFKNQSERTAHFSVLPERYDTINIYVANDVSPTQCELMRINARNKRAAWRVFIDHLQITDMMSTARRSELEGTLNDHPEKLPEPTIENVMAYIFDMAKNSGNYITEATREVFETLRPRTNQWSKKYKTNKPYEIGKRVIIPVYGAYKCEQEFKNIDNVFHLLDGKGPVKGESEVAHLIRRCTGYVRPNENTLETEYFKIKVFMNGNAHIEFKRMDLVAKLNEIGGGNMLKGRTE